MTEERWHNCHSVGEVIQLLNGVTTRRAAGRLRKFRLCGCHFLRICEPFAPNERFGRALHLAELHFDGRATRAELKEAITEAQNGYEVHRCDLEEPASLLAQSLSGLLQPEARVSASMCFGSSVTCLALFQPFFRGDRNAEGIATIHDIFGNPFRPVNFAPEWRTDTATAIARQMYESRDFSAMPILADALQDAGCDSDDILTHCREPQQVHVRGCWVVDSVLGKS